MRVFWSLTALSISALCLCGSFPLTEGGCDVKVYKMFAYYKDEGGNYERCKVDVSGCRGECYNSYEHFPHKVSDNYDDPNEDCQWSYRGCIATNYDNTVKELHDCSPVSGGSSAFDPNNPWTVVISDVNSCTCSSRIYGEGADGCSLPFA